MFFRNLLNPEKSLLWALFHIGMAVLCTLTPYALIVWFYLILITDLGNAFTHLRKGNDYYFISLLMYLVSFEMLGRMARCAPFVPTELGKYAFILFALLGLMLKGIRSIHGLLMLLLLLPALFFDVSGERDFIDIVYNGFGGLSLALIIMLLYRSKISTANMNQVLRLIWLTSLSALVFSFIKTPDLESIDFSLKAEFATTADTSSNQVATILGLGIFLSFYSIINRLKFSGYVWGDIAIMLLFAFQGLLSFSRGGIVVAVMGMTLLIMVNNSASIKRNRGKFILASLLAVVGTYGIFRLADSITGGSLLLRYQGETQGTAYYNKDKTADVVLSGRLTIFKEDLEVWLKHPILGVGAGSSRYMRKMTRMTSPHIEFSRLLSEQGILGLLYFILLLITFYRGYLKLPPESNKGLMLGLFIIAVLTSFHAAMRTYVTPAFFMLACLQVTPNHSTNKA